MYNLMFNLPVVGTIGLAALVAGPLARLPIDFGAWFLLKLLGRYEDELRKAETRGPCHRPNAGPR